MGVVFDTVRDPHGQHANESSKTPYMESTSRLLRTNTVGNTPFSVTSTTTPVPLPRGVNTNRSPGIFARAATENLQGGAGHSRASSLASSKREPVGSALAKAELKVLRAILLSAAESPVALQCHLAGRAVPAAKPQSSWSWVLGLITWGEKARRVAALKTFWNQTCHAIAAHLMDFALTPEDVVYHVNKALKLERIPVEMPGDGKWLTETAWLLEQEDVSRWTVTGPQRPTERFDLRWLAWTVWRALGGNATRKERQQVIVCWKEMDVALEKSFAQLHAAKTNQMPCDVYDYWMERGLRWMSKFSLISVRDLAQKLKSVKKVSGRIDDRNFEELLSDRIEKVFGGVCFRAPHKPVPDGQRAPRPAQQLLCLLPISTLRVHQLLAARFGNDPQQMRDKCVELYFSAR